MQKQIGSILLIAGTCIGSGVIALPMVLAKLGILPSLFIMIATWCLTYYTSLVSVELNLHVDQGLSLGSLGRVFSGKYAEIIGTISVKLLSYALLTVFIYGGSSVLQKLIEIYFGYTYSNTVIATCLSISAMIILLYPISIIDRINSILFIGLICVFLILIGVIIMSMDYKKIPILVDLSGTNVLSVITVVFTSFGYQVIFHTLRDYCGKNVKMLKRAFWYGSLIPAIVYILWTFCVLSVIYKTDISFYTKMSNGMIDVGDLIKELASISGFPKFQTLIWWMSISAILTSILGVGIGLAESVNFMLKNRFSSSYGRKILSSLITVIPSYVIAVIIPKAFIEVLGFAGAILVVIAILLPIYLLYKANIKKLYINELRHKYFLALCVIAGLGIIAMEIFW